jgi:uncharacterized membrane protein YfcA
VLLEHLFLSVLGIAVGMFGTIVGVGGGFILVPLLMIVYKATPPIAVGTSLCIVALNAISGSISYARQKRIDYRTGMLFALGTIPGAIAGASLIDYISIAAFDVGFGVFMMVMAAYMTMKPSVQRESGGSSPSLEFDPSRRIQYNLPMGMFVSFVVGFLSSLAGIGGGLVHVPAMIYLFHFPTFIAVSTSHFILAISTTVGAASHISLGHVLWDKVPSLGIGVIIGAQIGARLSHRIHTQIIVRGLAVAVVIAAIRLIAKHL